jgi:hypothetical protein
MSKKILALDTATNKFTPTKRNASEQSSWYYGGDLQPNNAVGLDGDYYIEVNTNRVSLKDGGVWAFLGKILKGPIATIPEGGTGLSSVGGALQVLRTNAAATALEFASVSLGGGDVAGPASSTDNGFAKFDGVTGKLLKNSAAVVEIADGGTGATSASAARTALGVGPNRVTFNQANFTVPAGASCE